MLIKHCRLVALALLILVIAYCCLYSKATTVSEAAAIESSITK